MSLVHCFGARNSKACCFEAIELNAPKLPTGAPKARPTKPSFIACLITDLRSNASLYTAESTRAFPIEAEASSKKLVAPPLVNPIPLSATFTKYVLV